MELAETMMAVNRGKLSCFGRNLISGGNYFAFIGRVAMLC